MSTQGPDRDLFVFILHSNIQPNAFCFSILLPDFNSRVHRLDSGPLSAAVHDPKIVGTIHH